MPKAQAAEAEQLPRTIVRRVVKDKLSRTSNGEDINLHKDALLAFSESARIFIHYLSATANDVCRESKRQIINADDVLKALDEIDFSEFIGPLKVALDDFRQKKAAKKSSAKVNSAEKKRKLKEDSAAPNAEENGKEDVEQEGNEDVEQEGNEDADGISDEDDE